MALTPALVCIEPWPCAECAFTILPGQLMHLSDIGWEHVIHAAERGES
jgi:hypothetical protein